MKRKEPSLIENYSSANEDEESTSSNVLQPPLKVPKVTPSIPRRMMGNARRYRWKGWVKNQIIDALEKMPETLFGDGLPGIEVCEEILNHFPEGEDIQPEDLQSFIGCVCKRTKFNRQAKWTPIDKWIEVMQGLSFTDDAKTNHWNVVMKIASKEPKDDTPTPNTFDPLLPLPDYSAIYEYFAKAFSGEPLPELTPLDNMVVEDLMQSLAFQVGRLNDGDLRRSLRKIYLFLAQDPNEEPEGDEDDLRKILLHNATRLNPLGINAQAIVPVISHFNNNG